MYAPLHNETLRGCFTVGRRKKIKKLRDITKKDVFHLIAYEIAFGFGRTGKMFAMEHAGVSPDIMCMSKGLTAGYYPMAIIGITQEIYDSFYADYLEGKSFLHSHTYSGNPIGCDESTGDFELYQGRKYKVYRGMGSIAAMENGSKDRYFQENAKKLVPEGVEGRVAYKGHVEDTVFQLIGGLRSGMGYCGAENIEKLKTTGRFIKISAASLKESLNLTP